MRHLHKLSTLCIACLLCFIVSPAKAQLENPQLSFGLNNTNFLFQTGGESFKYDSKIGFRIDYLADFNLKSFISDEKTKGYILVGLFQHGASTSFFDGFSSQTSTISIWYLSTNIGTKYQFTNEFSLSGGAFIDYGISGKQANGSAEFDVFKKDGLHRLNTGIVSRIDYKLAPVTLFADYKLGLINIEDADAGAGQTTKTFAMNFGVSMSLDTIKSLMGK